MGNNLFTKRCGCGAIYKQAVATSRSCSACESRQLGQQRELAMAKRSGERAHASAKPGGDPVAKGPRTRTYAYDQVDARRHTLETPAAWSVDVAPGMPASVELAALENYLARNLFSWMRADYRAESGGLWVRVRHLEPDVSLRQRINRIVH